MVVLLLGYRVESPGEEGTCKNFLHVQFENERAVKRIKRIYSLEIILTLGNRLRSDKGLRLKRWLDEYMSQNDENNDVIIYDNGSVSIDVRISPEEETVWLTQDQIAKLFDVTRQNVSLHIKSILEEGELYDSVRKEYLHTASDGKKYSTTFYNCWHGSIRRLSSEVKDGSEFRRWANSVLKKYLLKGYAVDEAIYRCLSPKKQDTKCKRQCENIRKIQITSILSREIVVFLCA